MQSLINNAAFHPQENWTPLMAASNNGHLGTVDILLDRKADLDKQDDVSIVSLICSSGTLSHTLEWLVSSYGSSV